MVKKIRCDVDSDDWVRGEISSNGEHVRVTMAGNEALLTVILTPSDARKLRKQIKKALEVIEGMEEESVERATTEYTSLKYSVGNTVRIIGNKYRTDNRYEFDEKSGHNFKIGELVNIVEIDINDEDRPYNCGGAYGWVTTEDIEQA